MPPISRSWRPARAGSARPTRSRRTQARACRPRACRSPAPRGAASRPASPTSRPRRACFPQSTCADRARCARPATTRPPRIRRRPTGACSLGCDKPAQPPTILTCPWTGPPVLDPTTLPACDNGGCSGAHCLPAAEVPASVQSQLAPCDGGAASARPTTSSPRATTSSRRRAIRSPGAARQDAASRAACPRSQSEAAAGHARAVDVLYGRATACRATIPSPAPRRARAPSAATRPPTHALHVPQVLQRRLGHADGHVRAHGAGPVVASRAKSTRAATATARRARTAGRTTFACPTSTCRLRTTRSPLQGCPATFLNLCGVCVSECIVNSELGVLGSSDCAANHKCVPCDLASSTPGCSQFCP